MTHHHILESCVETMEECRHALIHGADQLEVCSHMELDGLTPYMGFVEQIITEIQLPVKVMIRCRGGNFLYTEEEIDEMVLSIRKFKSLSIHGFVFGALTEGKKNKVTIDMSAIYKLSREAAPFPVTIHKAIDLCDNIPAEVTKLKSVSNIRYILSSGGKDTAAEGADMLMTMQAAVLPEIEIIAAGKITAENRQTLAQKLALGIFTGEKSYEKNSPPSLGYGKRA